MQSRIEQSSWSEAPLRLKDILRMSFSFIRSNFLLYVRSMGVVVVPLATIIALSTKNMLFAKHVLPPTSLKADISSLQLLVQKGGFLQNLAGIASLFLAPLAAGIASRITAIGFLNGIADSASATRIGMRFVFALAWASLIVHLIELVGLVALALPGLLAITTMAVVTPVIVLEAKGPLRAIRRSWNLLYPRAFRTFGFIAGIGLITLVANFIFAELSFIFSSAVGPNFSWVIVAVLQSIQTIVVTSFVAATATLIYLDARNYLENFHLDLENKIDAGDFFLD